MAVPPTLRQLRFLVALSDQLHFGKAADACFVTQSTLSSGIKDMEDQLGAQLVERTKRKVMMTPLGARMVVKARAVLADVDSLTRMAEEAAQPFVGDLTFGVIPTIGPYVLPGFMAAARKKYPDLRLYLKEEQTDRLLAEITKGDVDVGLLAFPIDIPDTLDSEIVGFDEFSFACAKGHPMAVADEIPRSAITGEDLLLLEDGHCLRDHALGACSANAAQKARGNTFQATSLPTLIQMVEAGLGFTLVPNMAVKSGAIDKRRICVRPISGKAPGRSLGLVWRSTDHRADEFQALAEMLRELLASVA